MIDIEKAMFNPSAVFRSPEAVVACPDLTKEQKIKILEQWEYDEQEIQVSIEENMAGNETSLLIRIKQAILSLK